MSTTDEGEEETPLTLADLLAKVGLQEKVTLFEQEQIDMESLVRFFFKLNKVLNK